MAEIAWASFKNMTQPFLPGCPWASIVEALQRSAAEFYERSHAWRTEPSVTFNTVVGQSDYTPVLPGRIARVASVRVVGGHYLQKIRRGYIEPRDYMPVLTHGLPNTGEYRGNWLPLQAFKRGDWITKQISGVDAIVFECVESGISGATIPTWTTISGDLITDGNVIWRVEYVGTGTPREYLEKNDTTITIFPTPGEVLTMAIDCSMKPDRMASTGIQDDLFQSHAERIASGAIYRLASMPIVAPWSNAELAAVHVQNFERGIDLAMARDMQGVRPRARPRMF